MIWIKMKGNQLEDTIVQPELKMDQTIQTDASKGEP